MSKYHSKKTVIDGIKFDSKKEGKRFVELKAMEKAGIIQNLRLQVKFELIPKQKKSDGTTERACSYIADFVYEKDGQEIIEDTKGVLTDVYKIKRKLMLQQGHEIKEI